MKKLLTILFVLIAFIAVAQDIVPQDTAYHALPTYSFKYYTRDSSVWIYKGAKYQTTKLVSNKRLNFLIDSLNLIKHNKNDTLRNQGRASRWDVFGQRETNKLPKFNTDSTFVKSVIFDNGKIHINGTAPDSMLTVTGGAHLTNGILADKFKKINGTATQFLMADGSVRDTVYMPRVTAYNAFALKNDSSKLYERIANKVTSVLGASTDVQYPSAKLLYDQLALKVAKADSSGVGGSGAAGKYATGNGLQSHVAQTTTAHGLGASAFHTDSYFQTALTNPYTGTGSAGQVAFHTGTSILSGDNGLFWDNVNKRLGIGTISPLDIVHIKKESPLIILEKTASTDYSIFELRTSGYTDWAFGSRSSSVTPDGSMSFYSQFISGNALTLTKEGPALFASTVSATQFQSTVAIGTAPLTVASTTMVGNLNADLLDGVHSSGFATSTQINASGLTPDRLIKWNGSMLVNSLFHDNGTIPEFDGYLVGTRSSKNISVNPNYANGNNFGYIGMVTGQNMGLSISSSDGNPKYFSMLYNGNLGIGYLDPGSDKLKVNGTSYFNGTGNFIGNLTAPSINLSTEATLNYFWKCTNATTGAGQWAAISSSQNYNGAWSAATNTPTLQNGVGTSGSYYHCTVSGTVNFGAGNITFVGGQDDVWCNGSIWEKNPGAQYALTTMSSLSLGGAKLGSGMNVGGEGTDILNILNEDKGDITVSGSGNQYGRAWSIDAQNSAFWAGKITDETGSGSVVFSTSPTLVTPALGTPSALVGTNITGTATALSIGGNAATASATTAAVTFNNSGTGDATGTTFNGSTARTISYNSIGAQQAGTYSTDIHSNITSLNAVSGTNTGDNATNSQYSGLVTMTYPGSGVPVSTGTAWGTSLTATTENTTAGTIVTRGTSGYVALVGTFCSSSDSTLKRKIRSLSETDYLKARQIDFRKFAFKADSEGKNHFGVMAQQVEKLFPELVNTGANGKKEVDYIELHSLVLAQQKELIAKQAEAIEKLTKRVVRA